MRRLRCTRGQLMTKLGSLYLNRLGERVSRFKKKIIGLQIRSCVCICVCMYVCACVYVCACIYMCIYVFFIFFQTLLLFHISFHRERERGEKEKERGKRVVKKKKNWTTRPSPKNHFFRRPKIVRNSFLVLLRIPFFFNSSDCVSL